MSSSTNLKKNDIPAIQVVALALRRELDGRYLVTRRGPGQSGAGEWEFPGGKLEPCESQKQALKREIEEELGFSLEEQKLLFVAENSHHYPNKSIQLFLWSLSLNVIPEIILTEHDQLQWCHASEMHTLGLSQADRPFIDQLK
ncbi:MAG: (deoxy)nucleoside triphosphate pyrophosphohydrolase [Bdellovibrio sp.]|nr:(deoxy)nucleoside triphosphate pyrophosphohydrolase [Bdellovibrio sp.]